MPTQKAVAGDGYFSGLLDVLLETWSGRKRRRQQLPYIKQRQIMEEREMGSVPTRGRLSICGEQPLP